MQRSTHLAMAAVFFAVLSLSACSNQNGAGGTVDGTSMDAYELNTNQDYLAPAMDSAHAAPADSAIATDSAAPAE